MLKIKAKEQLMYVGKNAGEYAYVMTPETYSKLTVEKMLDEASTHSGMSRGMLNACFLAVGDVIKNWATEGHSVPVPGLGTMRFGINAKAVTKLEDVSSSLITTRKVIFTPSVDIKEALHNTEISITCYDRHGNVVSTNKSEDSGEVEP